MDELGGETEVTQKELRRLEARRLRSVPRWRERLENDTIYHYLQVREASLFCLRETYLSPCVKTPSQLLAQLFDEGFKGWSLEWERKLRALCRPVKNKGPDLQHMFTELLPFGLSPALVFLDKCHQLQLCKRRKIDAAHNGGNVYEVMDVKGFNFLRIFQTANRSARNQRFPAFVGQDRSGMEVFKLVWKRSFFLSHPRIEVYCPTAHHIGTVGRRWSVKNGYYFAIASPRGHRFAEITLRRPTASFHDMWLDAGTGVVCDITLDGIESTGLIRGEWPLTSTEPIMSLAFPYTPIGLLTKVMTLVAWVLVFEDTFEFRLRGVLLPVSVDFEIHQAEMAAHKERLRRLARLH